MDTANNILSMKVDLIVMRHPNPGAPNYLAENTNTCVINAGDGTNEHPTQALLDCYSIKERHGSLKDLKVVIVGDIKHSRVALSNIYALKKLGAKVMVCGPTTLIPKFIHKLGVEVEHDLLKALQWCDVANMLRIQLERQDIQYFPTIRSTLNNLV